MKFTHILIPAILLILLFIWTRNQSSEVTMVKSKIDGQTYLVQNKPDKQQAAETLAQIKAKLTELVSKVKQKHANDDAVTRLASKFQPNNISEGGKDKSYTTYTLNKGEKIVFCLRTRDNADHLHNINLLLFVAIHELAHIMTLSTGHTPEFQKNFTFLLKEAVDFGLYQPENFRANPTTYCGIPVTDTPLPEEMFGGK